MASRTVLKKVLVSELRLVARMVRWKEWMMGYAMEIEMVSERGLTLEHQMGGKKANRMVDKMVW